ncbi:sugar porter family MFS transporter [Saccharopolyspora flava]|uniref:Uncharacterized protein n=1 Tax=Saccharopolyspora flava TaxID=95161 RepID=A0A1I6PC97_9PSEU|nr:sugar porter family MFS transporter [Saccharopolyspora flava]SFS37770.1 hypothetical protein SAMN05660874_00646 [Saccharopolyspora flava]
MSNRLTRWIRKIPSSEAGFRMPTTHAEWQRWSKPRRRWLIAIGLFAALAFVLAVLSAPTWALLTAFALAFLSQAPLLYYERREDHADRRGDRDA